MHSSQTLTSHTSAQLSSSDFVSSTALKTIQQCQDSIALIPHIRNEITQKQIAENTDTEPDKTMAEKRLQPHGILAILTY